MPRTPGAEECRPLPFPFPFGALKSQSLGFLYAFQIFSPNFNFFVLFSLCFQGGGGGMGRPPPPNYGGGLSQGMAAVSLSGPPPVGGANAGMNPPPPAMGPPSGMAMAGAVPRMQPPPPMPGHQMGSPPAPPNGQVQFYSSQPAAQNHQVSIKKNKI